MTGDRFIEDVHRLLQAGYASLSDKELDYFNRCDEPTISGGLAMRIQQLIDRGTLPGISRAWCVVDNWPESALHLPLQKQPKAKRRKLPDLKFRFGGLRETFYFRFEAKKLAGTGDYTDLISHEDGLGRFLRRVYGREDRAGGLLGYAQSESIEAHAERVKDALLTNGKQYRVDATGAWMLVSSKHGPESCFRVVHFRDRGAPIALYYSFLLLRRRQ